VSKVRPVFTGRVRRYPKRHQANSASSPEHGREHGYCVPSQCETSYMSAWTSRLLTGIYLMFITILCFLSVAMTIAVIHLHTNSVVAHPSTVPLLVSSQFLPRDAMIARYMLRPCVLCPSTDCLSVTIRRSIKTAKHKQLSISSSIQHFLWAHGL